MGESVCVLLLCSSSPYPWSDLLKGPNDMWVAVTRTRAGKGQEAALLMAPDPLLTGVPQCTMSEGTVCLLTLPESLSQSLCSHMPSRATLGEPLSRFVKVLQVSRMRASLRTTDGWKSSPRLPCILPALGIWISSIQRPEQQLPTHLPWFSKAFILSELPAPLSMLALGAGF